MVISRLAEAASSRTGLRSEDIESRKFALSLPVGDIELQLEAAYDAAVQASKLQAEMVARLQELRNAGSDLEDPEVDAEIGGYMDRIEAARSGAVAFEGERSLLQREVQRRSSVDLSRLKLWDIARLEEGLFILTYRERDVNDPSGARGRDHALLFLDTTPGREGAEAWLHQLS